MFYVENVAETENTWGGLIFAAGQKRLIGLSDLIAFQTSETFYLAVLNRVAVVSTENEEVLQPVEACAYVRGETKTDEQGCIIARLRQVPDDYLHKTRAIEFVTGRPGSVKQDWWPGVESTEVTLKFKKLEPLVGLVECLPEEATFTAAIWNPTFKTMPKRCTVSLAQIESDFTAWIGAEAAEQLEIGRFYQRISFGMSSSWSVSILEPRLLSGALLLYVGHPAGIQKTVGVELEYFTNLEAV